MFVTANEMFVTLLEFSIKIPSNDDCVMRVIFDYGLQYGNGINGFQYTLLPLG